MSSNLMQPKENSTNQNPFLNSRVPLKEIMCYATTSSSALIMKEGIIFSYKYFDSIFARPNNYWVDQEKLENKSVL